MRKTLLPSRVVRIGALIGNDTAYGGPILSGVLRYRCLRRQWTVRHLPPTQPNIDFLLSWKPDGVIAFGARSPIIDALVASGVPTVNVSHSVEDDRIPSVHVDEQAVGIAAAEHLVERGFRRFAVVGHFEAPFAVQRRDGFLSRVGDATQLEPEVVARQHADVIGFEAAYTRWLHQLPKPIGIFTIADNVAERLLDLCLQAGIAIPDHVAVVSANNDTLTAAGCWPPLSSVRIPFEAIGFEAARTLEQLLSGQSPRHRIVLPPQGVCVRQSSDVLATERVEVREAVQFMRAHLAQPITVSHILEHVAVSRRALELAFRAALGCTPGEHLNRLRMQRARELLTETETALPDVAAACGYADTSRFAAAFRVATGTPPARFRRASRIS